MSREDYNWLESNLPPGDFPSLYGHSNDSPAPETSPLERVDSPYYPQQPLQTQYTASSQPPNPQPHPPDQFFPYHHSAHQPSYRYQGHYYQALYYPAPWAPPLAPQSQPPAARPPTSKLPTSSNPPTSDRHWAPTSNLPTIPPASKNTATNSPQNSLTSGPQWKVYTPPVPKNMATKQPQQKLTSAPKQSPYSHSSYPSTMQPVPPGMAAQPPPFKKQRIQGPSGSTPGVLPPSAHAPALGTPQNLSGFYSSEEQYLKYSAEIVQPLNEASAAKKTTYNSETIARDVLIAAGRHPTEKPLNYHLTRLRDAFTHVDFNSDLASFRWDLVDPGEPADLERVAKSRDTPKAPRPAHTPAAAPPKKASPPPPSVSVPVPVPSKAPPPSPLQKPPQETPKPSPRPLPTPQVLVPVTPSPISTPKPKMVNGTGRKPGRPPKSKVPVVQVPVGPPVQYLVYKCEWDSCPAELHNLATLKKHTFKVHVPTSITCQWKGCTVSQPMPAVQLLQHMKKEHLEQIAWKQGDGPSVPGTVTDDDDATMSPSIATIPDMNQPAGEDPLIFPASYSSIRAFNRVHGNHTQRDKAVQILKAVQRLKEQVGFGLDPGGCQLATPARNERASNEEDVYDVKPF